jgi:lysozyme
MDRDALHLRLIKDEGVKQKPYLDTQGKVTIGVGRNLSDVGITMSTVMQMLDEDLAVAIAECQKYPWFTTLDEPRQQILVCMMFNIGATRFQDFQAMITCLKSGNFQGASDEMLNSIWAKQVPTRAQIYADVIRTGLWPEI